MTSRLRVLAGLALLGLIYAGSGLAECGGNQQCIGVGATASDAAAAGIGHHTAPDLGTPTFTLAFGNQVVGSASASQTIHVAAVTSSGTAVLGPITLAGADAGSFSITGGTCLVSNPVHGGTPCTITVAFNPATLGAKSARVDIPLNPPPGCGGCIVGRSVGLTGTGTGSLPGAAPTSISVPMDRSATVDLAPFISGSALLGIRIVTAPSNGTASVDGTRVTYAPRRGFLGSDAFTYESFSAATSSGPATVSVSVVARADPGRDPTVVGLLAAQAQAARRFSRAQVVNFQRRMESLHRGTETGDIAAATTSRTQAAAERGRRTVAAAGGTGLLPVLLASEFVSVAEGGSLQLASQRTRAGGSDAQAESTGVWIGGGVNFGTRAQTEDARKLRFGTEGISAGIDRRFSEKLALGVGIGYARDRTDVGSDGSRSRARGTSVAVYGSYQPTQATYIDGLVGAGTLRFDADRFVASANGFAQLQRKGDQWFGSLAMGYEHRQEGLLLSPYGRLDVATDRLRQATETGAGADALAYFEQKLRTLQFSVGLRTESQHQTSFGWAVPRLRAELRHDLKAERQATISYADQLGGPTYSVAPTGTRRSALLVGVGSDFLLRDGLRLGVDFEVQGLSGPDRSRTARVWLAKDLDGRGAPSGLASAKLFKNPVHVEGAYALDDNVNRTREGSERLSDHVYSLGVGQALVFPVTSHTRLVVNGFANGDKFRTFEGLDRFSAGAQGEFQYRASGEFGAPMFGVYGRASFDDYHSQIRSGYRASLGITYRQLLTDRVSLFGAVAGNSRSARNAVFDGRDTSARANVDYSLGPSGTAYLGLELRRGDAVSSGTASIESAVISKASVQDDAYGDRPFFAYRYEAQTTLWSVGYNRPLGPRDAIDVSFRHAASSPTARGIFASPGGYGSSGTAVTVGRSRYTANQLSAAYLMRF